MGSLFSLTKNTILPPAETKILKAEEVGIMLQAEEILDEAKKRAKDIVEQARQEAEQQKKQGYADGLEEGRLEHAEKIMETVLSSVEFIEGIESQLVHVVSMAIRKILGELDQKDLIVRIVQNALQSVQQQQKVTLRVAPEDEQVLRNYLMPMLQSSPGQGSFLDIIADVRLQANSCLLESELGVIDASLETQLKALENALQSRIQG